LPSITPILDIVGPDCSNSNTTCIKAGKCRQYFFPHAAHFPINRFTMEGLPIPVNGALIYEGMRFTASCDGTYEVAMVVRTADQVTIRLQLQVLVDQAKPCPPILLTLPPMTFTPQVEQRNLTSGGAHFAVRHVGYSKEISEQFGHLPSTCSFSVCRVGVARFGSGIE